MNTVRQWETTIPTPQSDIAIEYSDKPLPHINPAPAEERLHSWISSITDQWLTGRMWHSNYVNSQLYAFQRPENRIYLYTTSMTSPTYDGITDPLHPEVKRYLQEGNYADIVVQTYSPDLH